MIRVKSVPEPQDFDQKVRKKGKFIVLVLCFYLLLFSTTDQGSDRIGAREISI